MQVRLTGVDERSAVRLGLDGETIGADRGVIHQGEVGIYLSPAADFLERDDDDPEDVHCVIFERGDERFLACLGGDEIELIRRRQT